MKNPNFIEVYDNALPDDVCDYLIALFNRENNMSWGGVKPIRTLIEKEEGKTYYTSGLEFVLYDQNYLYDSVIADLDYILKEKIFDYNNKHYVWSSKLNMDLIPTEKEKEWVEKEDNNPQVVNYYLHRNVEWAIKKYKHPDDHYKVWHTDWSTEPTNIAKVLAIQFFLNDVEEGGETEFYHQGIKVKPKKGTLIIWPVGFQHTHRGNSPISNDKYTVATWVAQRNILK